MSGMSGMSGIEWHDFAFAGMTSAQLYAVLSLRSEVFVVEQACIFQDLDGADLQAVHVLGTIGSMVVAYARCFQAGIKFQESSIGRVVIRRSERGRGAGHAVMEKSIACLFRRWGSQAIRIGAQAHLENFYRQHGFESTAIAYCEDGIDHIEMLRSV